MSGRSQRKSQVTPKSVLSPRVTGRIARYKKPISVSYDYHAAISQPDLSGFIDFGKNNSTPTAINIKSKSQINKSSTDLQSSKNGVNVDESTFEVILLTERNDVHEKENTPLAEPSILNILPVKKKDPDHKLPLPAKNNEQPAPLPLNAIPSETTITKSSSVYINTSRIPRAKSSVHVTRSSNLHISHSRNTKPCVSQCRLENNTCKIIPEPSCRSYNDQSISKEEMPKFMQQLQNSSKLETNIQVECGIASMDESPAILSITEDSLQETTLPNLKLNCMCRSCTNHNPAKNIPNTDDTWSDFISPARLKTRRKRHSKLLKHRKYFDSTFDETESSSIYANDDFKHRAKHRNGIIEPRYSIAKPGLTTSSPTKKSTERTMTFSFLNALFDIVFWPYLLLKTNP